MASLKKINFVASPKWRTVIILINTTHNLPHTAAIETNPLFTRPTFNHAFYNSIYFCFSLVPSTEADVALVLDYATTPDNIEQISTFTTSIIDELDISPSGVHVAVITYGENATIVLKFNDLQGKQDNRDELKRFINTLTPMRGTPRIDRALQVAERELFTTEAGSRPGVPKVMFLVP